MFCEFGRGAGEEVKGREGKGREGKVMMSYEIYYCVPWVGLAWIGRGRTGGEIEAIQIV